MCKIKHTYTCDDKVFFHKLNKYLIKLIKKEEVKHCNQQGTQYSGKFVCIGNHIFSEYSQSNTHFTYSAQ